MRNVQRMPTKWLFTVKWQRSYYSISRTCQLGYNGKKSCFPFLFQEYIKKTEPRGEGCVWWYIPDIFQYVNRLPRVTVLQKQMARLSTAALRKPLFPRKTPIKTRGQPTCIRQRRPTHFSTDSSLTFLNRWETGIYKGVAEAQRIRVTCPLPSPPLLRMCNQLSNDHSLFHLLQRRFIAEHSSGGKKATYCFSGCTTAIFLFFCAVK